MEEMLASLAGSLFGGSHAKAPDMMSDGDQFDPQALLKQHEATKGGKGGLDFGKIVQGIGDALGSLFA